MTVKSHRILNWANLNVAVIRHGLALYFQESLVEQILKAPFIVTMFDESYNSAIKNAKWISNLDFGTRKKVKLIHAITQVISLASPLLWTFMENSIHVVQNSRKKISR